MLVARSDVWCLYRAVMLVAEVWLSFLMLVSARGPDWIENMINVRSSHATYARFKTCIYKCACLHLRQTRPWTRPLPSREPLDVVGGAVSRILTTTRR